MSDSIAFIDTLSIVRVYSVYDGRKPESIGYCGHLRKHANASPIQKYADNLLH